MEPINFNIQNFSSVESNPAVKRITISVYDSQTKETRNYSILYCKDMTQDQLAQDKQFIDRVSNLIRLFDAVSAAESALSNGGRNIEIKQKADGTPRVFIQEKAQNLQNLSDKYKDAGQTQASKREIFQRSVSVINSYVCKSTELVKSLAPSEMTLTSASSQPSLPLVSLPPKSAAPPAYANLDYMLDNFEFSPKPVPAPNPKPATSSDVDEFDDLLDELENAPKPAPTAPKPKPATSSDDDEVDDLIDDLLAEFENAPKPVPAPNPKPADPPANDDIDDLLADTAIYQTSVPASPSENEIQLIQLADLASKDKINKKAVKDFCNLIQKFELKPEHKQDMRSIAAAALHFAEKNNMSQEAKTLNEFLTKSLGPATPEESKQNHQYHKNKFEQHLAKVEANPTPQKVYAQIKEFNKLDDNLKGQFKMRLQEAAQKQLNKLNQPLSNVTFLFNKNELKLFKQEFGEFIQSVDDENYIEPELDDEFNVELSKPLKEDTDLIDEDIFGNVSDEESEEFDGLKKKAFASGSTKIEKTDVETPSPSQRAIDRLIELDTLLKKIGQNQTIYFRKSQLVIEEVAFNQQEVSAEQKEAVHVILNMFQLALDQDIREYSKEDGSKVSLFDQLKSLEPNRWFARILISDKSLNERYLQLLEDLK